jgi:hypothetical protein
MKKIIKGSAFFVTLCLILFFQTGCQKQEGTSISGRGQVQIVECKFARGKMKPEEVSDSFAAGDRVWVLYGISGFSRMTPEGDGNEDKEEIWIRQDLMITQEDGTIVFIQPAIVNIKETIKKGAPKVVLDNNVSFPDTAKKGKYTVSLMVTDLYTLHSVKKDYSITLY